MKNLIKSATIFASFSFFLVAITSFKTINSSQNAGSGKKWIPEDFHPKDVTLLIQKHPYNEKNNTRMVEFLEKEYPWKFEVASKEDIMTSDKYKDKKTYQFAMLWSDFLSSPRSNARNIDLEGNFFDRSIDKEYPKSGYALNRGQATYKKIFAVLIKKFKDGKEDE